MLEFRADFWNYCMVNMLEHEIFTKGVLRLTDTSHHGKHLRFYIVDRRDGVTYPRKPVETCVSE